MKKMLLACVMACLGINVSAQNSDFRFGVRGGMNLSTALVNDVGTNKFKVGYHIGATVEYQLPKDFLIQSGLFFSAKGSKLGSLNSGSYVGGDPDYTHTFNQLYLEVPIYVAYSVSVSDNVKLVFGGGPYLGYGVGGKTKEKLNHSVWGDGSTQKSWNTFGSDNDMLDNETLNRFDFGIGLKTDLEYNRYTFGIGASFSIIDLMNSDNSPDLNYRNVNLSLSLGYRF